MTDSTTIATDAGGAHAHGAPVRPLAIVVVGLVFVLILGATAYALVDHANPAGTTPPSPNGSRVSAFSLPQVGSRGAVVAPWLHGRGAVVMFFARWCVPCRAEVTRVALAVGAGDVGGVQFIGVDGDRSATAAATFVRTTGARFPVGHDGFLVVSSRIVPQGYPATVFVRPNGRIAALDYGVVSDVQLSAGLSKIKPT